MARQAEQLPLIPQENWLKTLWQEEKDKLIPIAALLTVAAADILILGPDMALPAFVVQNGLSGILWYLYARSNSHADYGVAENMTIG